MSKSVRWIASVIVMLAAASLLAEDAAKRPGTVECANLTYGNKQTSRCYASHFLADVQQETHVWTARAFADVKMEDADLFKYPFAVMSGEGAFTLTEAQRKNLREYLTSGGFLVASAGCSSTEWKARMVQEIALIFPDVKLETIKMTHPIFHTVYDITELKTKKHGVLAELQGLTIDDRIVMIYSPDGLNDTGNAGGNCCCCGGNEILNARQVNVNLLTYAVTH